MKKLKKIDRAITALMIVTFLNCLVAFLKADTAWVNSLLGGILKISSFVSFALVMYSSDTLDKIFEARERKSLTLEECSKEKNVA